MNYSLCIAIAAKSLLIQYELYRSGSRLLLQQGVDEVCLHMYYIGRYVAAESTQRS